MSDDFQEQLDAFNNEIHELIQVAASRHLPDWFLRAHTLTIGLYSVKNDAERIFVFAPEGQSGFTTVGLLAHAQNKMML